VDFSLKLVRKSSPPRLRRSFNPCFGGFFSKTNEGSGNRLLNHCFNPCFGGFFSKTRSYITCFSAVVLVSILVLVDFSLKQKLGKRYYIKNDCFNPCFGGFFSKTSCANTCVFSVSCFNPCFGGFFSKTRNFYLVLFRFYWVSILVLVDFSLKLGVVCNSVFDTFQSFNPCFGGFFSKTRCNLSEPHTNQCCFNPCFGGFFSKTRYTLRVAEQVYIVSILVLVDFSLKPQSFPPRGFHMRGFNPCFGGFFSKTPIVFVCFEFDEVVSILVLVDFSLKPEHLYGSIRTTSLFQSLFWWIFL